LTAAGKARTYYAILLLITLGFTLYEELSLRRWLFHHSHQSLVASLLAGSLPNFLAALILGLIVLIIKLPRTPSARLRPILAIVAGLSAYELAQLWMPNRVFDWADLLATILGGAVCWSLTLFPSL